MWRLLLIMIAALTVARLDAAEQWRSERYRCSLDIPDGESWVQGTPVPMPAGEMIYIATHAGSKQTVAVVAIPNVPNRDLENPAVVSRIMEPMVALGFPVTSHAPVKMNDETFLQLVGHRSEKVGKGLVCVARGALRETTLLMVLTFKRGSEELSTDKHFLRVLNTFKLFDPAKSGGAAVSLPLAASYRLAYLACWTAVATLLVAGMGVIFLTRSTH